ncbi:MAG: hypothetical protein L6R35_007121, partial [Caloplaca aegaea]
TSSQKNHNNKNNNNHNPNANEPPPRRRQRQKNAYPRFVLVTDGYQNSQKKSHNHNTPANKSPLKPPDGYPLDLSPSSSSPSSSSSSPPIPELEREHAEILIREEAIRGRLERARRRRQRRELDERARGTTRGGLSSSSSSARESTLGEEEEGEGGGRAAARRPGQESASSRSSSSKKNQVDAPPGGRVVEQPAVIQPGPSTPPLNRLRGSSATTPHHYSEGVGGGDQVVLAAAAAAPSVVPPHVVPHDINSTAPGTDTGTSSSQVCFNYDYFDAEIQLYNAEREELRQHGLDSGSSSSSSRPTSPGVLPSIPEAEDNHHPYQPQKNESDPFSSDGLDLAQLDPRRQPTATGNVLLQGNIPPATTDPLGFWAAGGSCIHETQSPQMQRRTAEDFLPEQWTEQIMNPATWSPLPDVSGSAQPRQRWRNTRTVAHPDPRVRRNSRSSHVSTGVPGPSKPSPTFSPYATTNQLGKRGRDNASTAANDDVVVVPDEGSAQEPRTKRQQRMQRVEKEGGKIGKDNRKENKVRFANGSLECLLNYEWVPAAYHNDRRHALLLREDRKGRY